MSDLSEEQSRDDDDFEAVDIAKRNAMRTEASDKALKRSKIEKVFPAVSSGFSLWLVCVSCTYGICPNPARRSVYTYLYCEKRSDLMHCN